MTSIEDGGIIVVQYAQNQYMTKAQVLDVLNTMKSHRFHGEQKFYITSHDDIDIIHVFRILYIASYI